MSRPPIFRLCFHSSTGRRGTFLLRGKKTTKIEDHKRPLGTTVEHIRNQIRDGGGSIPIEEGYTDV